MAESGSSSIARLVVLLVVLAAAGGGFLYMQSRPLSRERVQRIMDDGELIGKTLDDAKKVFKFPDPVQGHEEGVYLFDFSKKNPKNTLKIEVVYKGGTVHAVRELDERIPPPIPPSPGKPGNEDAPFDSGQPDQPADDGKSEDGTKSGG
jgi:hypothetical protein